MKDEFFGSKLCGDTVQEFHSLVTRATSKAMKHGKVTENK